MLILFVIAGLLFWALYKYWVTAYSHWEKRGLPYVAGSFPLGSSRQFSLLSCFQGESISKLYERTNPRPYFGIYSMRQPLIVVRDPEIIRLVLAKDFSHFGDRMGFQIPEEDFLSHNLFYLNGEKWRSLRVKIGPAFSEGNMKQMFPRFLECSEVLSDLLLSKLTASVDVKDAVMSFSTKLISSCAFGLEPSGKDLLRVAGSVLPLETSPLARMVNFKTIPCLLQNDPFRLLDRSVGTNLLDLVKKTVDSRKANNVRRADFLEQLIQLKERGKLEEEEEAAEVEVDQPAKPIEMTPELMAAQCFSFFVAGFETSSSVQSFCLYELALNPDVQERLFSEIDATIRKQGGLTYQAVQEMHYLDMVIHETMRKYPTFPLITRHCNKPFSMPAGNRIFKGDRLIIPVWSLHHDPHYFPNPEKFDPERFSLENRPTIKPFSYLPFGEGPRICIGMKFGLLQTKVGLITVLTRFKVSPSKKTEIPLKFVGSSLFTTTKGPIMLNITTRKA